MKVWALIDGRFCNFSTHFYHITLSSILSGKTLCNQDVKSFTSRNNFTEALICKECFCLGEDILAVEKPLLELLDYQREDILEFNLDKLEIYMNHIKLENEQLKMKLKKRKKEIYYYRNNEVSLSAKLAYLQGIFENSQKKNESLSEELKKKDDFILQLQNQLKVNILKNIR